MHITGLERHKCNHRIDSDHENIVVTSACSMTMYGIMYGEL